MRLIALHISTLLLVLCCHTRAQEDSLPEWYLRNRIHFHWEGWYGPAHAQIGSEGKYSEWKKWLHGAQDVIIHSGAKAVVAIGKCGAEANWWPEIDSGTVYHNPAIIANEIIGRYHAHGLKCIVYYRHDMDYEYAASNPEWLCRDQNGDPVTKNRGVGYGLPVPSQMCVNSGYRDIMKQRLVELAKAGADGIYFDQDHMPEVCYCTSCREKFKAVTGKDLPAKEGMGTQAYLDHARFTGSSLAGVFSYWKAAVDSVNPGCVLVVSGSEYIQFTGLHHHENMVQTIPVIKTEFQKCFGGQQHFYNSPIQKLLRAYPGYHHPERDLQESLAWMVSRDARNGSPAHIWVWKPDPATPGELLHTVAAVVSQGCVANISVPVLNKHLSLYQKVFRLNERLSPHIQNTKPYSWALIHVGNGIKEQLSLNESSTSLHIHKKQFEGMFARVLGAARTLQENHYPFATISDFQLLQGEMPEETGILIIPNYDLCTGEIRSRIDSLERSGIEVIRMEDQDQLKWYIDKDQEILCRQLQSTIVAEAGMPPVYAEGPEELKVSYLYDKQNGRILAGLVRNWEWFDFYGKHVSSWQEGPGFSEVKIKMAGRTGMSASLIDYDREMVLTPSYENDTIVFSLPGFDICSFVSIDTAERTSSTLIHDVEAGSAIYPNPASDRVNISFSNNKKSLVAISVINSQGKVVKQFSKQIYSPGKHLVGWDISSEDHPAGIYFCRISLKSDQTIKFYDNKFMIW